MSDLSGLIQDWHARELNADYGLGGARLVMGCPLYGEGYVNDFLAYCLPSLLANELEDCALILYVDKETESRLEEATEIRHLQSQVKRLPDAIIDGLRAEPVQKYTLLAAAHNLLIHKAGEVGAGFSMMCADMVWSEKYFANLLRLAEHHAAIAQAGFAVRAETGRRAMDRFRDGNRLPLSAAQAGQISWECLNSEWKSWDMAGIEPSTTDEMPAAHLIHWRARDHIRINSAHQNVAWMSPELCRKASTVFQGTIDSELPRYLGRDFYQPVLSDDMAMFSIAGPTVPGHRISFAEYRKYFWNFIGNDVSFVPFFTRPCVVPVVEYDYLAPSDAELDERLSALMARLEEGRA